MNVLAELLVRGEPTKWGTFRYWLLTHEMQILVVIGIAILVVLFVK